MRSTRAASDSSDHADRALCACVAHSAPRSTPLHLRLHVGVATLRSHASGFHTGFPHTAQATVRPLRVSSGFAPEFFTPIVAAAHSGPHVLLRAACSRVCVMNGLLQCWQIFQNGYTRFAFQCLGKLECFASAAFNNDAMVSADDLLAKIPDKTVGGIAVFIFHNLQNRLIAVFAVTWIVAQYAITYLGFMVRHYAMLCGDFGCIIEAAIHPRDHVPNFKPGILDAHGHPVLGAGTRECQ